VSHSITRVLVPTDFSESSAEALEYAAQLAARIGARIEVLHVVDDPVASGAWNPDIFSGEISRFMDDLVEDVHRRLDTLVQHLSGSLAPRTVVLRGQPARTIVDYARTGAFDLIVMGTHGRSGLSHALRGSVAEHVLRSAPCAVLTLKDGFKPGGPRETTLISIFA
jgi:nucleotide-binding universal stress UspA family protein